MEQERAVSNLKRQLRIQRAVSAVVVVGLIAWLAWAHFGNSKSIIYVDGRPVVCVSSPREAEAVLSKIKSRTGCNLSEIQFRQDVRVAQAPRDAEPVSRHRAMREVQRLVSTVVPRLAIIVDGKPVVAVPNRDTAGEVLEMAKLKFGKLAHNLAEEPQFKEKVTVDIAAVDPSIYRRNAQEALDLLFSQPASSTTTNRVYEVKDRDIAGAIAHHQGIGLAELWAMNPKVNLNHLHIGEKLNISKTAVSKPALTVIVRDLDERIESMPAPVESVSSARMYAGKSAELSSGAPGQRKVKTTIIYENGQKTGSEVVEEEVVRQPVPRRVAIGIKSKPTW